MKKLSLKELKAKWARRERWMRGNKSAERVHEFLRQTIDAGTYISNGFERGELQALAREVADTIFEQTSEYPTATIRAAPVNPEKPKSLIHNIPFPSNPVFTNRERELETLREQLQSRAGGSVLRVVAVCGLGGIGKTQLAVEYAWKHLDDYDAVLWVKADGPDAVDSGFAELAQVLALPEANERDQAVQIRSVLNWLRTHERWLLIADNADSESAIKALQDRLGFNLPGAALITSRISHWPVNTPSVLLDFLSSDDAIRFLQNRVEKGKHDAGDGAAARLLAGELGNLPLALEQAAAFIIEMRWSFNKYREQLRDSRAELLNYQGGGATHYPASVAKTWNTTLPQLGRLSRTLLQIAAWLAPDAAIPRGIFAADHTVIMEALNEGAVVPDLALDMALRELDRFSLIRLSDKTISVHRLLQAVEQDSLEQKERIRWLFRAAQLANAFAPEQSDNINTWDVWRPLAPHVKTLLEHAKQQGVETELISALADKLGGFFAGRGLYAQAEALFRRALQIEEEKGAPEEKPKVAERLNHLAEVLAETHRLVEAEPLYQRALAIRERTLGPEHPDVAENLNNLAVL